ncbi:hypothetical protein FHW69_003777 [Luteibacter sp. Sphag1AF]|uniref:hypothetical protein n=1 Tax=Luteibacter sp. Sphag1AF TaxID=2587031 RepID=UPI0016110C2C|nr:hypothetical protein [Luteibacter sp. Sphag1AF]MBB3229125.1 hypothetical protein [Luteibacter sp. Sphag1AF]
MAVVYDTPAVPHHPRINWRAVFAGWLVATGIAGLLYVAGLAFGFAALDIRAADVPGKGLGIGTAIWVVLTWVVALFLGGMFASWFDGHDDDTAGTLHGVTVWGLSVTTTALWLALGLGSMHGGRHDDHGPAPMGMAAAAGGNNLVILKAEVDHLLPRDQRGGGDHAEDVVVGALLAGNVDTARTVLTASSSLDTTTVSGALDRLAPVVARAQAEAKDRADRLAHYTSMALWIVFFSGFLALIAAAVGGWAGTVHIHRIYHRRRYEGRPFRGGPAI